MKLKGHDTERTLVLTCESGASPVPTCESGTRCVSGAKPV